MNKKNSQLFLEEGSVSIKMLLILVTIAYIFSIAVRLIWVYQFQGEPSFF